MLKQKTEIRLFLVLLYRGVLILQVIGESFENVRSGKVGAEINREAGYQADYK